MPVTEDGRAYERKVVELHPDTAERLQTYLDYSGKTAAHVIREALQCYLKDEGYGPAHEGRK